MTDEQKQLIRATVPILKEHGVLLTKHFYSRMFTHNPELKNMFNMGNQQSGKQQTALAMAVLAYAENIANPGVLMPVVNRIGHKHVSLDIRPEHYQIVGKHLIESIKEVLGDAASPAIVDAWTAAYLQLAALMSGHESEIYNKKAAEQYGWTGWRPFTVKEKIAESAEISSFHLYPADGGHVMKHIPGQYISVRTFIPELNIYQARQYSISSVPNTDYYRISVKREKGVALDTNGVISNHLHDGINVGDVLDISAPAGDFRLDADVTGPVVLISGGVGLTPMISMLQNLVAKDFAYPVTWLHGCRNRDVHAFRDQIDEIVDGNTNVEKYVFYDLVTEGDRQAGIREGILSLDKVERLPEHPNTRYYVCGPAPFIRKQYQDLIGRGVSSTAIHFEEFGPSVIQMN